ncbi:putative metal-dependent HD superfamily phosphohydrolase [Kineosphaera limosa]|nr:DUF3349 domain-containing protein [Kineosphaera limosa]NYD99655.1 putative metal-dependent HD superfamily phosphohydrolase [Kineosphaera limosa]
MAGLSRILNWLRVGYPQGIPERDFLPLFALLSRRLSDEDARDLGSELVVDGLVPADRFDLAAGYLKKTDQLPSEDEIQRVAELLYHAGWDVSGILDTPADELPPRDELLVAVRRDLGLASDALLARYDEPQRAYHNRRHLTEAWGALERLLEAEAVGGSEAKAARLALWFHDSVYDPRADDNEALSAAIARAELRAAGESTELIERVAHLVEATVEHAVEPGDRTAACLMDADLWVLSAPPPRYREYVRQIRREYAHVSRPNFITGRQQVLRYFIGRGPLYATGTAASWEAAALANMARELADYATYHPTT